jgi:transcriptional regulator with XRE-family HTH domain
MVTSAQIRAARALLNWTVRDLAEKAGVHRNTVTRAETDATGPGHATAAIRAALESAGVVFSDSDGMVCVKLDSQSRSIPVDQLNAENDE